MSDYSSALMGAHFRGSEIRAQVEAFSIGKKLSLRREPGNAYDPNAIQVLDGETHVGFIERGLAETLAPLMDASPETPLEAKVVGFLQPSKPFLELTWITPPVDEFGGEQDQRSED